MAPQLELQEMMTEYTRRIKVLNERIWEGRVKQPLVDQWLLNFTGAIEAVEVEKLYALHLLSNFMYFGAREMRELLRSLYRDQVAYPLIQQARSQNSNTTDSSVIDPLVHAELLKTRFMGIGNPSESGPHLLYYFRQENGLSKSLFMNSHEIFDFHSNGSVSIRDPSVRTYVFIDDLAGSGKQAVQYSKSIVAALKALDPTISAKYFVLFATADAVKVIRSSTAFDNIEAVFELDETFYCFGPKSRYYPDDQPLNVETAERIIGYYGWRLWSEFPLGYDDCQLLLGFHHNTPDNTIPIIWHEGDKTPWIPAFKRYPKNNW